MVKKTSKRKPARKAKPDASQRALASVEQIIGGKLSDGMNLPKQKSEGKKKAGKK
jgi:hypothetical protein